MHCDILALYAFLVYNVNMLVKIKRSGLFPYLLMHAIFLLYSFYTVLGKVASGYAFLSPRYCMLYASLILVLAVYAVLWQQVLKRVRLSVATANKAVTIIWGMLWSALFFKEEITVRKLAGVAVISVGILVLSLSESRTGGDE